MTKMYKMLYTKMYDDLKDAEMLIDYAYQMKEEKQDDVAKYFGESAAYRISKSFKDAHTLFTTHASQEKDFSEESITHCLWDAQHEQLLEWCEKITKKIEKFK